MGRGTGTSLELEKKINDKVAGESEGGGGPRSFASEPVRVPRRFQLRFKKEYIHRQFGIRQLPNDPELNNGELKTTLSNLS